MAIRDIDIHEMLRRVTPADGKGIWSSDYERIYALKYFSKKTVKTHLKGKCNCPTL